MAKVVYDRVALIGLGLIASSMYWAIKRAGLVGEVTGFARSEETRQTARRIGLCDRVCDTVQDAVQDADLIVLCVPVGVMGDERAELEALRTAMDTMAPLLEKVCVGSATTHPTANSTAAVLSFRYLYQWHYLVYQKRNCWPRCASASLLYSCSFFAVSIRSFSSPSLSHFLFPALPPSPVFPAYL